MIILAILSTFIPGWGIAGYIKSKTSYPELIGLAFLIGVQIFTLGMFVANYYLGINLNILSGWLIMTALAFTTMVMNRFNFPGIVRPKLTLPGETWQRILLFLLIFMPLANLVLSFYLPVLDWDAVTMFDFRAKVILDTGWIRDTLFRSSVISYPLLTSLSHFWLYLSGANTAMPLYPVFYSAFILVSYSQLRQLVAKNWVLPCTLLLAVAPKMFDQSLVAYANLPYSIYLITGSVYLYLWLKNRKKPDLVLGLILSVFSLWARTFPFAAANILAVFLIYPKTRKTALVISGLSGMAVLVYLWPVNIDRVLSVFSFTKWAIFDYYFPYTWIFVFLAVRQIFMVKKDMYWPLLITLYFCLYLAGNYYFAGQYGSFAGLPDAAQRMMMFINPAIIWFSISVLYDSLAKNHNSV